MSSARFVAWVGASDGQPAWMAARTRRYHGMEEPPREMGRYKPIGSAGGSSLQPAAGVVGMRQEGTLWGIPTGARSPHP